MLTTTKARLRTDQAELSARRERVCKAARHLDEEVLTQLEGRAA
jgi:hypothetical protein